MPSCYHCAPLPEREFDALSNLPARLLSNMANLRMF